MKEYTFSAVFSKKIEQEAGEVRLNDSFRVGAVDEGRYIVFHPDNLPGRQLYVDGSGTGWRSATAIQCSIKVEISFLVYEKPEMGTTVVTSLCNRKSENAIVKDFCT